MTKQDAISEIIARGNHAAEDSDLVPEVGEIYMLEETANNPVRVVMSVKGPLTKSTYDFFLKATTGNVYLFKITKVNQHKYMDWDYNTVRIHTHSIDGELRCMAD